LGRNFKKGRKDGLPHRGKKKLKRGGKKKKRNKRYLGKGGGKVNNLRNSIETGMRKCLGPGFRPSNKSRVDGEPWKAPDGGDRREGPDSRTNGWGGKRRKNWVRATLIGDDRRGTRQTKGKRGGGTKQQTKAHKVRKGQQMYLKKERCQLRRG